MVLLCHTHKTNTCDSFTLKKKALCTGQPYRTMSWHSCCRTSQTFHTVDSDILVEPAAPARATDRGPKLDLLEKVKLPAPTLLHPIRPFVRARTLVYYTQRLRIFKNLESICVGQSRVSIPHQVPLSLGLAPGLFVYRRHLHCCFRLKRCSLAYVRQLNSIKQRRIGGTCW